VQASIAEAPTLGCELSHARPQRRVGRPLRSVPHHLAINGDNPARPPLAFHSFIDEKALDRGRAFSGLLGLARYSAARQHLQALSNTRAFNGHFDTTAHAATKTAADRTVATLRASMAADYESLVKEKPGAGMSTAALQERCHAALHGIALLVDHCADRPFMEVDLEACLEAVKGAEVGLKRERLSGAIREEATWVAANKNIPSEADLPALANAAAAREQALSQTAGDIFRRLYRLGDQFMSAHDWPSPTLCPTCGKDDGTSVLDTVRAKLGQYDAVETATTALANEWAAKGWGELQELEALILVEAESPYLRQSTKVGEEGTISMEQAKVLSAHVGTLRERAKQKIASLVKERGELEKELPPSLVTVTL
jgi:hypothetical protein